jgi:aryl-alcohol dehydrogenase-like predicted oxidoreductase
VSAIPRVELAPGYSVARAINGGWQLATDHAERPAVEREALAALLRLAEAGFTTFDCADIYAGVERLLGRAASRWRERAGAGKPLQLHTKYVPDRSSLPSLTRRDVVEAIRRSRRRLGVERLDLVQLHWWDYRHPGWVATALHLAELQAAGRIGRIGVTNFDGAHLGALLDAGVPVVANQVQYSLLDRRPEHGLATSCRERGVALLCYGTLAGGFLSERWLGQAEPPVAAMPNRSLTKYRLIIEEAGGWSRFQRLLELLAGIAERQAASIANVATRWVLDRPGVAAVILGAATAAHLDENRRLFDLELGEEDRAELDGFLAAHPGPAGDVYGLERLPGGRHAAILRTELHGSGAAGQ